jgi:hypothetical protein
VERESATNLKRREPDRRGPESHETGKHEPSQCETDGREPGLRKPVGRKPGRRAGSRLDLRQPQLFSQHKAPPRLQAGCPRLDLDTFLRL